MAGEPFKKPRVRLHGDSEVAQQYLGSAYNLLHRVQTVAQSAGVPTFASAQKLDDGTTIYAGVFGQERVVQVWPAGTVDDAPQEIRPKAVKQKNSLAWMPVGFVVTPTKGDPSTEDLDREDLFRRRSYDTDAPLVQKILTPIPRNNYQWEVYKHNGGSGGFSFAPLFSGNSISVRNEGDYDLVLRKGVNGKNQQSPLFTPIIFSATTAEIEAAKDTWLLYSPESVDFDAVYSPDVSAIASSVMDSISRPDIVHAPAGVFTGALSTGTLSAEKLFRFGLGSWRLFAGDNPPTLINGLNTLDDLSDNPDINWVVEFGLYNGQYAAVANATSFGYPYANSVITQYGSVGSPNMLPSIAINLLDAIGDFQPSPVALINKDLYFRGQRLYLGYYNINRANDYLTILGSAMTDVKEFSVLAMEKQGDLFYLHADIWGISSISEPRVTTTAELGDGVVGFSSLVFSRSGSKFAVLVWHKTPHPNNYILAAGSNFNQRSQFGKPSYGYKVSVVTGDKVDGQWVVNVGERVGVEAKVSCGHSDVQATDNDMAIYHTGLIESEPAGSFWRRTMNYSYEVDGEHPTGLAFDGESLVIAYLHHKITIKRISPALVSKATVQLDGWPSGYNRATTVRAALNQRLTNPIYFSQPSHPRPNQSVYEFEQTLKANGQEQVAVRVTGTDLIDEVVAPRINAGLYHGLYGYDSTFLTYQSGDPGWREGANFTFVKSDALLRYYQHVDIIDLSKSSFLEYTLRPGVFKRERLLPDGFRLGHSFEEWKYAISIQNPSGLLTSEASLADESPIDAQWVIRGEYCGDKVLDVMRSQITGVTAVGTNQYGEVLYRPIMETPADHVGYTTTPLLGIGNLSSVPTANVFASFTLADVHDIWGYQTNNAGVIGSWAVIAPLHAMLTAPQFPLAPDFDDAPPFFAACAEDHFIDILPHGEAAVTNRALSAPKGIRINKYVGNLVGKVGDHQLLCLSARLFRQDQVAQEVWKEVYHKNWSTLDLVTLFGEDVTDKQLTPAEVLGE